MQAIKTKYIGATNAQGSRIKATCERGSITIPYPYELSGDAVHRKAVDALIEKFAQEDAKKYDIEPEESSWKRPYITGEFNEERYHVFVNVWDLAYINKGLGGLK